VTTAAPAIRPRALPLVAVLVGGMLGTALRFGIDLAIPHAVDAFPLSTLVVNVLGALALGLLVANVWPTASDWLKAGLGAGLLGSFTTFSALAVSVVAISGTGDPTLAIGYLAADLGLGLGAALLGLRLGNRGTPPVDLENE